MDERKESDMIVKHRCKCCGIEIYEAAQILDSQYWVSGFCDICVKKDKRKATALKAVEFRIKAVDFLKQVIIYRKLKEEHNKVIRNDNKKNL